MALPLINDVPKYEVTLPSTGKKYMYRPYLVKEEKVLMMALESKDLKHSMQTVADTVVACLNGAVAKEDLMPYDVEYLFMKIRAKSVGETATMNVKCSQCEHENKQVIGVDDVKLITPDAEVESKIAITDDIYLELRHASYETVVDAIEVEDEEAKVDVTALGHYIEAVVNGDDRIVFRNESIESQNQFVESLSVEQVNEIKKFVENVPVVTVPISFDCEECGKENEFDLAGIQNFF